MNNKDREALDKFVDEDTLSPEDTKKFAEMSDGERATFIAERFFEAGAKYGRAEMQNAYETLEAHDEMLIATVDKLKKENKKLVEALKFYANRFSWTESDHPTHEYYAGSIRNDDSLVEYTEADGDIFKDFCGGKLARQVLKEIGEE